MPEVNWEMIGNDARGGASDHGAEPKYFRGGPCVRDVLAVMDAVGVERGRTI